MRLFDKCLSQGPTEVRTALRELKPTVFAIDEIANHYYVNDQMLWDSDDFPYAKPPWKTCFVEWNQPPVMNAPEGIVACNPSDQFGAGVAFFDSGSCVENTIKFIRAVTLPHDFRIPSEASCTALLSPVAFSEGRMLSVQTQMAWFMDLSGRILKTAYFGPGLEKLTTDTGAEEARRFFDMMTHMIALAFTFANCANVKLEDVTEELQPPPKIMRRLKLPCVKRYTLNIAGHVSRPRRESKEPLQTGVMPFHLCRGHFATYTAEKPLFGRHVGRFWIPPHTKGKQERGIIEKDYAVL